MIFPAKPNCFALPLHRHGSACPDRHRRRDERVIDTVPGSAAHAVCRSNGKAAGEKCHDRTGYRGTAAQPGRLTRGWPHPAGGGAGNCQNSIMSIEGSTTNLYVFGYSSVGTVYMITKNGGVVATASRNPTLICSPVSRLSSMSAKVCSPPARRVNRTRIRGGTTTSAFTRR